MSHSTGPDASRRTVSYRDLFSVPGYSPLLAAQSVSRLGDSVHYIALAALMFSLTRSGLSVSVAVVFEALPVIMFGAVAGAVVDRLPRRRVMLVADVVRYGLALLMAQTSTIPAIYALAFGLALAGVFYGPAYQALLPVVVPGHVLGRANALSWSAVQSSHVLGAAIGGAAVAVAGPHSAFVLNAATFLISALLLLRVPEPPATEATARPRLRTDVRQGVAFIGADPFIRRLLAVQVLAVLSVGGPGRCSSSSPANSSGSMRPTSASWSPPWACAFLGPLLFGRLVDRTDSVTLIFIPYLVRGVIDAALAFLTGFWVPAALLMLYGINTSTGGIAYTHPAVSNSCCNSMM